MELRHLRYFVAVAEELSFTRAAERLHISQSPLSRRIQDLEGDIGALLFDRSGSRLELTPAGHEFLRQTVVVLDQVQRATESARLLAEGHAGTIRIGYMAAALYTDAALGLFKLFQQQFPKVRFSFMLMPHAQQFEALADGRLDLGLVYGGCIPSGTLAHVPLTSDPLEFMFPIGHPLLSSPRLELADMREEPFVMPFQAHMPGLFEQLTAAWAARNFRPRVVMDSDSFATTAMLVSAGVGIAFAGRQAGQRFSGRVGVRAADDFEFTWGADMVWLPTHESPILKRLLAYASVNE
ncbi:LysR family transcriptional regulator [Pseudomonas putida]|uniref:LysR family transcriptional regulator n=1 Tax=Pseudomonas putida TaxID=303 RepID=A0A4D6XBA0_PSEPU|nr:LysR family transcriptional regulator [Pseudomonas putida]QCI13109.1 LysR family transcriptional regulator [Pseudomonas putida]